MQNKVMAFQIIWYNGVLQRQKGENTSILADADSLGKSFIYTMTAVSNTYSFLSKSR